MTEELKAKLHKVLMDVANDYANSVNPELDGTLYTGPDLETAFAQIDQAYKEAGYVQWPVGGQDPLTMMRLLNEGKAKFRGQSIMTGQEWYALLEDHAECNCESHINQVCDKCQIIKPFLRAAKKAAGIA